MSQDQPQRAWRALCPNCGAPLSFASAASASAVCSFCKSTLLRDGETLKKIGHSAELFEDYSPLQLGASGRYQGEAFSLLGRQQIAYEGGSWNEWHALFDNGRSGWLSEDNGRFVFGFASPTKEPAPDATGLKLDQSLVLAGQSWRVAALTQARVAAAEGELPEPPSALPGFLVAELRSSRDEVATLEYSVAPPRLSIGRPVRLADLAMQGLRQDSSKDLKAKGWACPNCGAALTPRLDSAKSIVCTQCKSVVDISGSPAEALPYYAQENALEPLLAMGSQGRLPLDAGGQALPWQVVGYQERYSLPMAGDDDEEQSYWREYLLFNRTEGFAFLVDSEAGWSLVRPLTGAPARSSTDRVRWKAQEFRRQESYRARVSHVLGEFYWQVRREDEALVSDYVGLGVASPLRLSCEQMRSAAASETVWSLGRSLDAEEIARAFGLKPAQQAALKRDVGAAAANGLGQVTKVVLVIALILVVMLLMRGCEDDRCSDYRAAYGANSAEYAQCLRQSQGSGVRSSGGGSWGGFSSGGGGHK